MKKTKTSLPIDLPFKLRKEFVAELAELAVPLTIVFNHCLQKGVYPTKWKFEWVTPVPKVKTPKAFKRFHGQAIIVICSKSFE